MTSSVPPGNESARFGRVLVGCIPVVLLLAVYATLALSGVWQKSITFDELAHITAGYSYWKTGDYRLNPENGHLPQRWAGLGMLPSQARFPSLDQDAWRASNPWVLGDQFLFDHGNDADALVWRGRVMIVLLGVGLCLVVWGWSRQLFGPMGGLISLTLCAFSPTLLAHGSLVTSDMAAALFFTASLWALWTLLHRVTVRTVLLSVLAMTGLFLSKMSAVLIIPVGLLLLLLRLAVGRPLEIALGRRSWSLSGRVRQLGLFAGLLVCHVVFVWAAIWACFDFRYAAFKGPPDSRNELFPAGWGRELSAPGRVSAAIGFTRRLHLLPEAYLYGFAFANHHAQQRRAFLNGEFSRQGWVEFFPYCLLVKTPLTVFGLLALAAVAGLVAMRAAGDGTAQARRTLAAGLYNLAPFGVFLAIYWTTVLSSHLNIGHRHLLPTYPMMFILAGGAGFWLVRAPARGRLVRALPVLLLLAFAAESLWTWPNYLAYFNMVAGGPSHAYEHLVDSSLDWGQDLLGLKKWLEARGLPTQDRPVYLSYFGTASPEYYKIRASLLPCYFSRTKPRLPPRLRGGVYCISATMLQAVYLPTIQPVPVSSPLPPPLPWTPLYESMYQKLRDRIRQFEKEHPGAASNDAVLRTPEGQDWIVVFRFFEEVRLGRLCAYLRQRKPDDQVGHSILIYSLSDKDIDRALVGPPPEGRAR